MSSWSGLNTEIKTENVGNGNLPSKSILMDSIDEVSAKQFSFLNFFFYRKNDAVDSRSYVPLNICFCRRWPEQLHRCHFHQGLLIDQPHLQDIIWEISADVYSSMWSRYKVLQLKLQISQQNLRVE